MKIIMKIFKNFFDTVLSIIYPNTCVACNEIISKDEFLCDYCYEFIKRAQLDKFCTKCGNDKESCLCKNRVYSFAGVTAPFYNENIAQKAMYAYKIGKRKTISKFFSYEMAKAVKYSFPDVDFNGVCFVPISKKSYSKRGFDQSGLIALEISEILNIPLYDKLECIVKSTNQHKMYGKERFNNIKGAYKSKGEVKGNILLVDDIKTSGATLNECAKVLLSNGANEVYCVTGLITEFKKG